MKKLLTLLALLGTAAVTSAQVTFTALDGTDGYNDEDIPCLFDGLSSKWCANASGAWFSFEASELITLTGYAMRTGSDGETDNNNRNPKSWTIYGSNDNSSWTQIQQVTDNTDMDGKQQKTFYFTIEDNFTLYKYYKFTFQAVQSGNTIQISELIPSYTKYAEVSSLTGVDGGSAWTGDQAWTNMIDGNLSSKWSCWPWDDRDWFIVDAGAPIVLKRYMLSTGNDLVRLQCAFIDTPEVEAVTEFIGNQRGFAEPFLLPEVPEDEGEGADIEDEGERDSLFEEAARIVVQTQQGSTSMIQRKLKLGYNRAGRIIDQLEAAGIVGPFSGSKSREVKVSSEMALEQILRDIYNKDNGI